MESKISLCPSPEGDMPGIRMNLDSEFLNTEDAVKTENMSVFARIRPMLQREEDAGYKECIAAIDDTIVRAVVPKTSLKFKNSNHAGQEIVEDFKYSQAFGPETGQFVFFEQTIMNTMQSFIDGQNCLIFSYGITNSGKTYTLQGNDENPGIIILALRLFFASIEHQLLKDIYAKPDKFSDIVVLDESEKMKEIQLKDYLLKVYSQEVNKSGDSSIMTKSFAMTLCDCFSDNFKMQNSETTLPPEEMEAAQSALLMKNLSKKVADQQIGKCNIWISFIEIYNEYIYDLLQPNVLQRKKLLLAEDQNGDVYVKGAKEVCVSDVDEALKLLHLGRRNLKIACTKLNYQSSRSHCIYIIKVVRFDDDMTYARVNRLSFCDLAGSERASKSDTSGMRLKEAGYINTSLLVLGRCLEQLRLNQNIKDKKMIPFRESKLTRLFSNHFMGKGKAVMIANASPCEYTFDETLNVLRFSALAKELLLNDSYMKMTSNSLQNITNQWAQSRAQASSFSLDQSSDMESSLLEDLQVKDEMIEKLLDLADSLRANLENERKQKTQLEYNIRQDVCREFSEYSDELLARQKAAYEEQFEEWKQIYTKRLNDLEKAKDEKIKELKEELAEYEASSDESFKSVNDSISLKKNLMNPMTPKTVSSDFSDKSEVKQDLIDFNEELNELVPSEINTLSDQVEKYKEENRILGLDICSLKNQLEMSLIEAQKRAEENSKLQNELQAYKDKVLAVKTDSENFPEIKCDHLSEIERLTSDMVSLRQDLSVVTSERDALQKQLDQMSLLLKDSQTNESATLDKCINLDSKLQEALQVLEQYEKEIAVLKSTLTNAENKCSEYNAEKLELQDTVYTLSEELDKLKSEDKSDSLEKSLLCLTDELKEQKKKVDELETEKNTAEKNFMELQGKLKDQEECFQNVKNSLYDAESKADELESKLKDMNQVIEELKSKIFALESECEVYKNEAARLSASNRVLEEEKDTISENLEKVKKEKDAIKKTGDNVIKTLKSELTETEMKSEELKLSLNETSARVQELEETYSALREEWEILKADNKSLSDKLITKEELLENFKNENQEILQDYINKLEEATSALNEEKSYIATLKSEYETLKAENEKLSASLKVLGEQIENTKIDEKNTQSFTDRIEEMNLALNEEKSKVLALESECESLRIQNEKLFTEGESLREKIEKFEEMKAKLEEFNHIITEKNTAYSLLCADFEKLSQENIVLKNELDSKLQNEDKSFLSEKELVFENDLDIESYKLKLAEKEEECDTLAAEYNNVLANHDTLKMEFKALSEQMDSLTKNIEEVKNEKKSAEEALNKLKTDAEEGAILQEQNATKILEISHKLEEKNAELSKLQNESSAFIEKIVKLEEKNKMLTENSLDLTNKLDAANIEAYELKKKLESINTERGDAENVKREKELLEEKYKEACESNTLLGEKLNELNDKNEKISLRVEELQKLNSDLELHCTSHTEENKKLKENLTELEKSLASISEQLNIANNEINKLKEENQTISEKSRNYSAQCELIQVLQMNELKASNKVISLEETLSLHVDNIRDLERQISEKESNISSLEEALFKLQDQMKELKSEKENQIFALKQQHDIEITESMHLKSITEKENVLIKAENAKLKRKVEETKEKGKAKKKSAVSKVENETNKENSDSNSESLRSKRLDSSSSFTSEESDRKNESRKTRRALRPRQPEEILLDDSDTNIKSTKNQSKKRKSSDEFMPPPRKTTKKQVKASKIPSKSDLQKEKRCQIKTKVLDDNIENMSPVQKVAAFVGSAFNRVAQSVSSVPSPRMTRGRRKLFNVDSAPVAGSTKTWKY